MYSNIITDNNECATNNGGCEHNCTNNPGNFTCSCNAGYTINNDWFNCDGKIINTSPKKEPICLTNCYNKYCENNTRSYINDKKYIIK